MDFLRSSETLSSQVLFATYKRSAKVAGMRLRPKNIRSTHTCASNRYFAEDGGLPAGACSSSIVQVVGLVEGPID